jgi:hypothetical protein
MTLSKIFYNKIFQIYLSFLRNQNEIIDQSSKSADLQSITIKQQENKKGKKFLMMYFNYIFYFSRRRIRKTYTN